MLIGGSTLLAAFIAGKVHGKPGKNDKDLDIEERVQNMKNTGKEINQESRSQVYVARDGSPQENMRRLVASLGGIGKFIGPEDVVIIKPNGQWWNQGMTNTDSIAAFIDEILRIRSFSGDILVCENHHFIPENSRGWTTDQPNGRWNLNGLISHFRGLGYKNIDKVHWRDAGPNPHPLQGNAGYGKKVTDDSEEDGYVWNDSSIYVSTQGRRCMMTYPVFRSPVSGDRVNVRTGVDIKNGMGKRPLVFVNFSGLNHHGHYSGVTASIKNLMGVVDMTCGYPGLEPVDFWSTHYIGKESLTRKAGIYSRKILEGLIKWQNREVNEYLNQLGTFDFRYTGGALGYWMRHVRRPTMNFISAEWVGWGGRTDKRVAAKTSALLASTDPVALDYVAAKDVLLKATKEATNEDRLIRLNDPDIDPFHGFLVECQKECGGNIERRLIDIHSA